MGAGSWGGAGSWELGAGAGEAGSHLAAQEDRWGTEAHPRVVKGCSWPGSDSLQLSPTSHLLSSHKLRVPLCALLLLLLAWARHALGVPLVLSALPRKLEPTAGDVRWAQWGLARRARVRPARAEQRPVPWSLNEDWTCEVWVTLLGGAGQEEGWWCGSEWQRQPWRCCLCESA